MSAFPAKSSQLRHSGPGWGVRTASPWYSRREATVTVVWMDVHCGQLCVPLKALEYQGHIE